MQLPLLSPRKLHEYSEANNEEELLKKLEGSPLDLILFFEYACDDETWSEAHPEFMHAILLWLSLNAYHEELPLQIIERATKTIQKHYPILKPFVPLTVALKYEDRSIKVNNLLLGAASQFFHDFLVHEWQSKGKKEFVLKDVSPHMIDILDEYVSHGMVEKLWKLPPEEIRDILRQSIDWELNVLAEECQNVLKRYIDRYNATKTLIQAHVNGWKLLKNSCIEFINPLNLGVRFEKSDEIEELKFEFIDFKENAQDIFQEVNPYITHLIFGGTLIADPQFSKVIHECPKLEGIDLSRTSIFDDRLYDLPPNIIELEISNCPWLFTEILRKLFQVCPAIKKLSLACDVQLPFSAWPELQRLRDLTSLNIARCHQITDPELRLIAQSCPGLNELIMENCIRISDRGFFDMPKNLSRLYVLNLAHCALSDLALMEIGHQCKNLSYLNISYCLNITDKGVIEVVRVRPSLRILNLFRTPISAETIQKIHIMNPALNIL